MGVPSRLKFFIFNAFFLKDLPYQPSHSVAAQNGESSAGRVESSPTLPIVKLGNREKEERDRRQGADLGGISGESPKGLLSLLERACCHS